MHVPILSSGKKNEKRKASVVSVGDEVTDKKEVKREQKKTKKTKQKKSKARSTTPENPHPEQATPAISHSPSTMSDINRTDSVTQALTLQPTSSPPNGLRETQTEPTPRRSSRIKEMTHAVTNTWTKARPYIERINGTIMPLEPQAGTKTYYARDGVRVD